MLVPLMFGKVVLSPIPGDVAVLKEESPNSGAQGQGNRGEEENDDEERLCHLCGRHHSREQGCSFVDIMTL